MFEVTAEFALNVFLFETFYHITKVRISSGNTTVVIFADKIFEC